MSDQQRWFKLWHSALSDDNLNSLTPALRWAWAAFGCHTKVHGESGRVTVNLKNQVLAAELGVPLDDLETTLNMLPHMHVERNVKRHDEIIVTWNKWRCFQIDATMKKRSASRRKRRGEERRSEQRSTTPPISPEGGAALARRLFEFWKWGLEHPKAVPDKKRLRLIALRLKDGYSFEAIARAVVGLTKSAYHLGENDRHQVYDDIALICRDSTHLERFMDLATEEETNGHLQAWEREAVQSLRPPGNDSREEGDPNE